MAKERNDFRFSKRPLPCVLGSCDKDFAQAVRECCAEGIPVMVLAKQEASPRLTAAVSISVTMIRSSSCKTAPLTAATKGTETCTKNGIALRDRQFV